MNKNACGRNKSISGGKRTEFAKSRRSEGGERNMNGGNGRSMRRRSEKKQKEGGGKKRDKDRNLT